MPASSPSLPVSPLFDMRAVAATALSGIRSSPRISEIVNMLDLDWLFLGERLVMVPPSVFSIRTRTVVISNDMEG
jgi:hypothetical protein